MKNLAKILSLSLLVLFASCKKDEDNTDVNQDDLVGTWNLTAMSCTNGKTSTAGPGFPTTTSDFTASGKNYAATVTFNADGTYLSTGSYTAIVTTKIPGFPDQTVEEDTGLFTGTGTWSVSGNTLTAISGGQTSTVDIEELTATTAKMNQEINVVQDLGGGFSSTVTGTYKFTLTK